MSSAVYYRFRSSKTSHRLAFDGTGISIFEIKRGILLAQKLDATADSFQLVSSNPDTHETYDDDSEVLPRSSLVEARRLPVFRQGGHDSAAQYVSGSLAMSIKNASRREDFKNGGSAALGGDAQLGAGMGGEMAGGGSEQDMMNAMFAQQGAQWSRTQQEMATKTKIYTPRPDLNPQEPDKTSPPGYICHRCGQKGHWINNCPSLYDRNWETKKVSRTTGIPKSMLRTVQKPEGEADTGADGKTYLMNADGEYVVAVADDRSWQAFQDKQLQNQARNTRPVPPESQDPITHNLSKDPRAMPCCDKVYSYESIENALIQSDFTCPSCGKTDVFIDQLKPNKELAKQVVSFEEGENGTNRNSEETKADTDVRMPDGIDGNDAAVESDDSDYSPSNEIPTAKKRRMSESGSSDVSAGSHDSAEDKKGAQSAVTNNNDEATKLKPPPAFNPLMMIPMFNPFLLPAVNSQPEDKEDSDYDPADDQPVVGRIR